MRPYYLVLMVATATACSALTQAGSGRPAPLPIVRADTAALRRSLDSIGDAHQGVVGYSVIDLETGARLSRRGDETFPTASLIKVPILVTVFDLVAKGQLSLDDPLTVLKIDQVPGSGVIQYLHNGTILTVNDAAWLMSTISHNTATNLLLDRIIIRRVWAKMDSLGLKQTRVHSNYAEGARAAHKSGETNAVRTECTLWYLRNRVVACVMTKENKDQRWILDSEPQLTVANMGRAIISAFGGVPPAPPSS